MRVSPRSLVKRCQDGSAAGWTAKSTILTATPTRLSRVSTLTMSPMHRSTKSPLGVANSTSKLIDAAMEKGVSVSKKTPEALTSRVIPTEPPI